MLKKFLLGLVVVCGGGVANAALLVNYAFTGTNGAASFTPPSTAYGSTGAVAPGPTSFSEILTAGAFSNQGTAGNGIAGSINTNAWRTANSIATAVDNARFNFLTMVPTAALGGGSITIDSLSFNLGKVTSANGNVISVQVEFRPTQFDSWVVLGTGASNTNTTLKANTVTFATPIVLNSASTLPTFRFLWSRTDLAGADSNQGVMDDLSFFGTYAAPSTVPEPTSMAVFGLLGAGVAARRFRRKA